MPAKKRSTKSPSNASKKVTKKVAKKGAKKVAKKGAKTAARKTTRKVVKKAAKKATRKVAKKATKRAQGPRKNVAKVSAAARNELIETAAYLRAEKRNFQNGDPVADWLSCEKEVDALLSKAPR